VTMSRFTDEQRAFSFASDRALQTQVQAAQVMKTSEDLKHQLVNTGMQRRLDLMQGLQESLVKLSGIASRLEAIDIKLRYTASVQSQFGKGALHRPEIVIYRSGGKTEQAATEDAELSAGDVLEVTLFMLPAESKKAAMVQTPDLD